MHFSFAFSTLFFAFFINPASGYPRIRLICSTPLSLVGILSGLTFDAGGPNLYKHSCCRDALTDSRYLHCRKHSVVLLRSCIIGYNISVMSVSCDPQSMTFSLVSTTVLFRPRTQGLAKRRPSIRCPNPDSQKGDEVRVQANNIPIR